MCYRTGKHTVCRRVPASFCPEILQAGAVKGLRVTYFPQRLMAKLMNIVTHTHAHRGRG